ncbi:MAG: hypothetical protein NC543_08325 [bacterium]|nr:hypothetical protein [bacterium]MCM1373586.1 hypothetical protein [Muribaculum sp.]
MIFLPEFENRIIIIKYGSGSSTGEMKIVVQRFMEEQTVAKIKKLLNIIRTSYKPDDEQVIADFCKQWLSQYEAEQKVLANSHVDAKEKARQIEIDIVYNQRARERYKKNTEPYKQYTELLKTKRKALSDVNKAARSSLTDFNRNQRVKEKYEKVLEIISQG